MGGQIGNTKVKSKFRSKIEVGKNTGRWCLVVHYHRGEDNFNESIEAAHKHHGIKRGQMMSIAMPEA
jgi:hypothetical protein